MYAIIATGGKQYKVAEGDVIKVERLGAGAGETVTFDQVLAVNNGELQIGCPEQLLQQQLRRKARERKLSFTSIREKLAITKRMVTDSSLHRLRSKRSTLNCKWYDPDNSI